MGNVFSSYFDDKHEEEDPSGANDVKEFESDALNHTIPSQKADSPSKKLDFSESVSKEISEEHKQKLNEFRLELDRKHEKRRNILAEKRKEMEALREEIEKLKQENSQLKSHTPQDAEAEIERLRKENEDLRALLSEKSSIIEESEIVVSKNHELRIYIGDMQQDLQRLNVEVLKFDKEREEYKKHVVALKDVIAVSKTMIQLRESQIKQLKEKIDGIEKSLADREVAVMSEDLRKEYERQIANMKNLRVLYEDRQRTDRREKEELVSQLDDTKKDLEEQNKKSSELENRILELELDNSKKYDEIKSLESNIGLSKAENRQYQAELAVINQLFCETLLRYNSSQELNLDKLQKHLEDHHGLLKDIVVNEVSTEVSYALPKVLLELINQLYDAEEHSGDEPRNDQIVLIEDVPENGSTTTRHEMSSPEEIVENLPKVWRVLIELLSHQVVPTNVLTDDEKNSDHPCYKQVETPKGTSAVLSVSKTFIRLKDLILEKKSLEKETAHLKHLNGHLENRLQDQEKRLALVQNELSKTWLVVGKLQKQHQMLHTQEKILRYELAQKRKLLNELKEELEYSREKCNQAREKNTSTEEQWKQLRTEFASRRNTTTLEDLNNSAESGYSDDRECSSDEEPGYESDLFDREKKNSGEKLEKDLADLNIDSYKNEGSANPEEFRNSKQNIEKAKGNIEDAEETLQDEVLPSSSNKRLVVPTDQSLSKDLPIQEDSEDSRCSNVPEITSNNEESEETLEVEVLPSSSNEHLVAPIDQGLLVYIPIQEDNENPRCSDVPDITSNNPPLIEVLEDCISSRMGNESSVSEPDSNTNDTRANLTENKQIPDVGESLFSSEESTDESLDSIKTDSSNKCDNTCTFSSEQATSSLSVEQLSSAPSTSQIPETKRTLEEVLAGREERLRRLEGQAISLVNKATSTANRSEEISSKLDNLHEIYGDSTEDGLDDETKEHSSDEQ